MEDYSIPSIYRIQLLLQFSNKNEYLLDEVDVNANDGSFSLFGLCMIPTQFEDKKMRLSIRILAEPFVHSRVDRLDILNFKEKINYLVEYSRTCYLTGDKDRLYFADDIELTSNNGILNIFNLYIKNDKVYDVFGEVNELTGLLIANDAGKTGSVYQLKSFLNIFQSITNKTKLRLIHD